MKIGIDARLWDETGVGRYIRNLVWQLQVLDKKNDYVLFVSKKFSVEDLGLKNKNWKIVETNIRWHTLAEQIQLPKIIEKENLDLVHFPYFSAPIFYKKPFIVTIHDLIINHFPTGKASTLPSPIYYVKLMSYKFIVKQAAQKAQKVIAVSEATKKEIIDHLHVPSDKISVTYEGVDFREKESLLKKNSSFHINVSDYFLYVGNAYPHKNLDRLIEAFKLVIKDYPDCKLVLVGKEDYFYKRLHEKVKAMGIKQHIIFTGYVPEEALALYYKNARATIIPSLMEGFGLPGLEAMQLDCLVLASDIPVFREIYQDAAVYFNPLAVESMHATIREVLQAKKAFASYKEKGGKCISSFSWEKMAKETLKIYENYTSKNSL